MKKVLSLFLALLLLVSLTIPALAADTDTVRPSVTAKDTPELVVNEVEIDGKKVFAVAEIVDLNGNPLTSDATGAILPDQLHIVSYADAANDKVGDTVKDATLAEQITKSLIDAYKELTSDKSLGSVVDGLDAIAKMIDSSYNASVFYVSDLFNISLTSDVKLSSAGGFSVLSVAKVPASGVRLTFKMGAEKELPTLVLRSASTGKWTTIPSDRVAANGDGTFSAVITESGTLAFLRVDSSRLTKEDSSSFSWWIILIVVVVVAVVVVVIIVAGKKAPADKAADKKDTNKKS